MDSVHDISVGGEPLDLSGVREATRRRVVNAVQLAQVERQAKARYHELNDSGLGWEEALDRCAREFPISRRHVRRVVHGG